MMTLSNGNIFRVTGRLCGEYTGPGEFPAQRPVTRSFDVFFDLRLNKRLNKQTWGWWFETSSWSLWRHGNAKWSLYSNRKWFSSEFLLRKRGFWCSLNNTYPIFMTLCIRCTNHLCDSCDLTDVNPHFIPSLLRMIKNVDLLLRHRCRSRPPAIVTSQWQIVPALLLWTLS